MCNLYYVRALAPTSARKYCCLWAWKSGKRVGSSGMRLLIYVAFSLGFDCVLDVHTCKILFNTNLKWMKVLLKKWKGTFHKWHKGVLTRSLKDFHCQGKKKSTQCLEMLPDFIGWSLKTLPAWYASYLLSGHFELVSADCIWPGFKSLLILQWTFNKPGLTLNQYLETLIKIKQEEPKDQMIHCGGVGV